MDKRYAVIDLGSNTFHLLIGAVGEDGLIKELYRERVYVKLAEKGVEKIDDVPFKRGISTLMKFRQKMDEWGIQYSIALGTATLRRASNAQIFLEEAADKSGIVIQVIDGEEEAKLIHLGVKQAFEMQTNITYLIMDIGGGSVEFILCNHEALIWHRSFPAGVAVLRNAFQENNTLTSAEQLEIHQWLDELLIELVHKIEKYRPSVLVGASGTFEVLQEAIGKQEVGSAHSHIDFSQLHDTIQTVLTADFDKIQSINWIPAERKDLIQVAFVLIKWVVNHTAVQELIMSHYAMKEGAFERMKQSEQWQS